MQDEPKCLTIQLAVDKYLDGEKYFKDTEYKACLTINHLSFHKEFFSFSLYFIFNSLKR